MQTREESLGSVAPPASVSKHQRWWGGVDTWKPLKWGDGIVEPLLCRSGEAKRGGLFGSSSNWTSIPATQMKPEAVADLVRGQHWPPGLYHITVGMSVQLCTSARSTSWSQKSTPAAGTTRLVHPWRTLERRTAGRCPWRPRLAQTLLKLAQAVWASPSGHSLCKGNACQGP